MTQSSASNVKVLYQLSVTKECVEKAGCLYRSQPMLREVLENPTVSVNSKKSIIEKIFSQETFDKNFVSFLKWLCDNGRADEIEELFREYASYWDYKNDILIGEAVFSKEPSSEEVLSIKDFLEQKYQKKKIIIHTNCDPELLGGTLLKVGHEEYDFSCQGRFMQLKGMLTGR